MEQHSGFLARAIDDDFSLLEASYRLRYQVYCVERQFLEPSHYPDRREVDEFEDYSVHLGVIDSQGGLAGTARLIAANPRGFPMFRHCAFFPEVQTLDSPEVIPVEVSRVAISRAYARRRSDGSATSRFEPFLTLVKAMVQGARRAGATHMMGATDSALHRWLVHFGLPYRVSGPAVDYYGPVAPCVMSLRELDQIIATGQFPSLQGMGLEWDADLSPAPAESGLAAWSHRPPSADRRQGTLRIMAGVADIDRSQLVLRSQERAVEQFRRAAVGVPFYRRLLADRRIRPGRVTDIEAFRATVPIISKRDVFTSQPLASLLLDQAVDDVVTLISSSGLTASSFSLGLINGAGTQAMVESVDEYLDARFQTTRKKTFVINTCAMGITIPTSLPSINLSVRSDKALALLRALKPYTGSSS